MSFYAIALFVHIVGVIVIFMATAVELLCLHRVRGAITTDQLREWASLTKMTASLFPFGGVTMVVTGLYMSLTVWDITVPWIGLSLAVVVIMSVFGLAVNTRRLEAIAAAAETEPSGPVPRCWHIILQSTCLIAKPPSTQVRGILTLSRNTSTKLWQR